MFERFKKWHKGYPVRPMTREYEVRRDTYGSQIFRVVAGTAFEALNAVDPYLTGFTTVRVLVTNEIVSCCRSSASDPWDFTT